MRVVLAGSGHFLAEVTNRGSPLWNVLKLHYLTAFDEATIRQLIGWVHGVPPTVADAVWKKTGGHPFITQYLMHYLWRGGVSSAGLEDVERVARQFFHERRHDLDGWRRAIGPSGQAAYRLLLATERWLEEKDAVQALRERGMEAIQGLMALCYHGLAIHDGSWSRYRWTGQLFREWFLQNVAQDIGPASIRQSQPSITNKSINQRELITAREVLMSGIPQTLLLPLRRVLMDCDEFHSPRQLYAIIGTDELKPFQVGLPSADNLSERVDVTIGYLSEKRRTSGENALVLLLQLLGERYDPVDERHGRLLALASQLEWLHQRPPKPEATVLEANPEAAQMLWIADAEKMLVCARAVARVEVPRFRNGKLAGKSSGTGWLISPNLALTCWHVVEARGELETSIDPSDLQAQFDNTLLTFDYTVAGEGLQYGVATVEHPTAETQSLDYAVLRLDDRDDAPLNDQGYLRLDVDAPLNAQTSLYIIQHPLGQPQQSAGDTFVCPSPTPDRILYKTPTEPGTSGAPVLNRINWRVVALHNGENENEHLREGTLLKSILFDLEGRRPDLYREIITAQNAKE